MIFGLIVFFLYLYFFVGFGDIFLVVKGVNLAGYAVFFGLALFTMILVMLCWVSSWRTLLKELGVRVSFKNAFMYYWVGYFVDLIVPCQQVCGEVTRLYLVQKETEKNYGAIAAAGIANRTVAYTVVTVGLSAGVIYILIGSAVPIFALDLILLAWAGALAYLTVLLYLVFSNKAADKIAAFVLKVAVALRIRKHDQTAFSPEISDSLRRFHQGFEFFRTRRNLLVKPFLFQCLSYALNLFVYVLVFFALGQISLFFGFFVVVYFLAGAIQDATSAFSVGGLEILLTNIFIFYGLQPGLSGVAAAVLRSATFWFPLLVGYAIVQLVGAKKLLSPKTRERIEAEQKKSPLPSP